jgi:serine O-acetyltransferase
MSQIARAEDAIAGVVDPVWTRLRQEAEAAFGQEPALRGFVVTTILNHPTR